jgi:catechol 2,3-dioxygenase-like lactoylglutathione lyase family enzyme
MARLVRLDHVQLAMPEGRESDAAAFYVGVLGLVEEPKPPALAARGGCRFRDGDVVVHLGVDGSFRPATKAHPAFIVDDLDELIAELAKAGWAARPDDALEGVRRAFVDDPFGNRIELIEDRAASHEASGPATRPQ